MFSVDLVASILAIIALVFAIRVERRNTMPGAKLICCDGHTSGMSVAENRGQPFHEFRVRIRNVGIALHNTTAHLVFNDAGDVSVFSSQMRRLTEIPGDHEEFAKGMIAEFAIKSYDLDPSWVARLLELTDPHKQRARIVLKSQGFDAVVLPIGGRIEKLRGTWNRWAFKINQRFWRKRRTKSGRELLDIRGAFFRRSPNGPSG